MTMGSGAASRILGRLLWLAIASLTLVAAGGCATFAPSPRVVNEPASGPPTPFASSAPIALVLSGGAARGFAHVGVLKVLEQEGIRPDLIVGSSAGSIVGALYASGRTAAEVDQALAEMSPSVFRDLVLPGLGWSPGELGVVKGERLRIFVRDRLRAEDIERFPIPFAAVATDLQSGEAIAFNRGDASLAVVASSAVPGLLVPAQIRGRHYGDGQISSPLPVGLARALGATRVIAVDVLYPPGNAVLNGVPSVLFQAFTIGANRLRDFEAREADVVLRPRLPVTDGQLGLEAREVVVRAGEAAAREALPAIRALLARDSSTARKGEFAERKGQ